MPTSSQGDIFEAASRVQLAIIFGYVGFNEMRHHWVTFAAQTGLSRTRDPFTELGGHAVEWSPGKWLWFIAAQENHGMTDEQMTIALDAALSWASDKGITSIATNGIANSDNKVNTIINRRSDDMRATLLESYAQRAEKKYGVAIELISLNDVFTRPCQ